MTHVWYWRPVMGEKNRKGMRCRVLITRKSKVLVEMEDGEMVVAMRHAVRRVVGQSFDSTEQLKVERAT